jgi:hypothetical protein
MNRLIFLAQKEKFEIFIGMGIMPITGMGIILETEEIHF